MLCLAVGNIVLILFTYLNKLILEWKILDNIFNN